MRESAEKLWRFESEKQLLELPYRKTEKLLVAPSGEISSQADPEHFAVLKQPSRGSLINNLMVYSQQTIERCS